MWRGVATENRCVFFENGAHGTQPQRKYGGGLVSKGCVFFFWWGYFLLTNFLLTISSAYQVFSCSGSFYLPNCSGKRVPDPWQWLNKDCLHVFLKLIFSLANKNLGFKSISNLTAAHLFFSCWVAEKPTN